MSRHVMWNRYPWGPLQAGWLLPENVLLLFLKYIFVDVKFYFGRCFISAHWIFCSIVSWLSLFEKLRQVMWLFFWRKRVFSPLAPFKIFRLSLVLSSLSVIYFESILLVFLCDSWICELIRFISFGKILSNSFFKYCFCHFLLTLSFCISGMERITFSSRLLPYILPWNHCASCLSVLPSGCFHLIFLPAFSSATSSLLSAIYTGSLILLILLFNFTWIFFWCFSSPMCLNYYLFLLWFG